MHGEQFGVWVGCILVDGVELGDQVVIIVNDVDGATMGRECPCFMKPSLYHENGTSRCIIHKLIFFYIFIFYFFQII